MLLILVFAPDFPILAIRKVENAQVDSVLTLIPLPERSGIERS